QVSTNGAYIPRWSRDGRELFCVEPDLTLMAVSIKSTSSSLEAGVPTRLFKAPINSATLGNGRNYDVAADGRFLVNVVSSASGPASVSAPSPSSSTGPRGPRSSYWSIDQNYEAVHLAQRRHGLNHGRRIPTTGSPGQRGSLYACRFGSRQEGFVKC